MSTRANVIIKDDYSKLYFYRHSDGYPEGTRPTLNHFMTLVGIGKIRDNVQQAAGWLIILGALEYKTLNAKNFQNNSPALDFTPSSDSFIGWKCGTYEPTTGLHGDIDYLYVLDLKKKTIETFEGDFDAHDPKVN